MTSSDTERSILDLVVPKLEDVGYAVYRHPPRQLLPSFMGSYIPDAIALWGPKNPGTMHPAMKNLAIEIVREGQDPGAKESRLAERFLGVPDWELRIYYARPGDTDPAMDPVSHESIEAQIQGVESLAAGHPQAALLMAWSILEAIGRALVPTRLGRAQAPARLIEFLAGEGIVTPDEADQVRRMAVMRNRAAHGGLETPVAADDVRAFLETLKLVLRENAFGSSQH